MSDDYWRWSHILAAKDAHADQIAQLAVQVAQLATTLARLEDWTYNHTHPVRGNA